MSIPLVCQTIYWLTNLRFLLAYQKIQVLFNDFILTRARLCTSGNISRATSFSKYHHSCHFECIYQERPFQKRDLYFKDDTRIGSIALIYGNREHTNRMVILSRHNRVVRSERHTKKHSSPIEPLHMQRPNKHNTHNLFDSI